MNLQIKRFSKLLVLCSCAAGALDGAQACIAQDGKPDQPTVPSVAVAFGKPTSLAAGSKGAALAAPFLCSPDGTVFFREVEPPDFLHVSLYAAYAKNQTTRFDVEMVPGLSSVSVPLTVFITDSSVISVVKALTSDESRQEHKPPLHNFLLVFSRDGSLQRSTALDLSVEPRQIAAFQSGKLLVIGEDRANHLPHVLQLDAEGKLEREILLEEGPLTAVPQPDPDQAAKDRKAMVSALLHTQILAYGDNLVLVPLRTTQPIVELNERGVIRVTKLSLPQNKVIGSMLPSDGQNWTVRVVKMDPDKRVSTDAELDEFDPTSGDLLRQLTIPGINPSALGCEHDKTITALSTDPETGKLQVLRGEIPSN